MLMTNEALQVLFLMVVAPKVLGALSSNEIEELE
jgi:hypothetical protein